MTLNDSDRAKVLAKACVNLISTFDESRKEEMSVELMAMWNSAVKFITPIEFLIAICKEISKGNEQ